MAMTNNSERPDFMKCLRYQHSFLVAILALGSIGLNAAQEPYSPYVDREFPTELLFGETHVHSALSADAGGGGTKLMPRDVYRFARGDQLLSNTGQPARLARPFDFFCADRAYRWYGRHHRYSAWIAHYYGRRAGQVLSRTILSRW